MNTLFGNNENVCYRRLLNSYSLTASKKFIECADKQLTEQFIQKPGIKPGKHVSFTISSEVIGLPI